MTAALRPAVSVPYRPSASANARLQRWRVVLTTGVSLAIVVAAANVLLALNKPAALAATCSPRRPCPPPSGPPIRLGERWASHDLGYSFEYDAYWFDRVEESGRGVRLQLTLHGKPVKGAELWIEGAPAADKGPEQMLSDRRAQLQQFGLVEDTHSGTTIFGPSIGFVRGFGGSYSGTGANAPVAVAIVAAGNNRISVVLSFVIAGDLTAEQVTDLRGIADVVLKTFRWPS